LIAAAAAVAATSPAAFGQVRIVSFNGYNGRPEDPLPRSPWIDQVLGAIGSSVSDDPFMAGNTGITKPIDVLFLQEVESAQTTVSAYCNIMNSLYPGANYVFDPNNGATTGGGVGTQGVVYNANAVQVIGVKKIGTVSGSGIARQPMRYQIRPVGYGSAADMYVYNVHYKAGTDVEDPNNPVRRNIESQAIRADVTSSVPVGANIMYTGDFNVYGASEAAVQTLIAPGHGQAIDPINQVGEWHNNVAYIKAHTQSPYNPATATSLGTGFVDGATGGMDDRFDFQWLSANALDGDGFAYIHNSYQAFGNNGTHTVTSMNQPINSASNTAQPKAILDALAATADHVPVVADYQLPAKRGVSIAPPTTPPRVIIDGAVTLDVTVSNTAPVQYAIGADVLNYSVTTSGAVSGSASGTDAALGGANTHTVTLTTATAGNKSGTINVSSTSEAVANNNFASTVNYAVLEHARPSFDPAATFTDGVIDLGYVPIGSNPALRSRTFVIANRTPNLAGFGAALDVDSVTSTGDAARLTTTAAPFTNLAAGSSVSFSGTIDASVAGNFAANHAFATSDENLPGATPRATLNLGMTARVFSVANFPVNGYMFLPASEPLTTGPFSIAGGVTLTKTGPGAMTISGAQSNGVGSQLVVTEGRATFQTSGGGQLALNVVNTGTATFDTSSELKSLAISGTGSADLKNHHLVLRSATLGTSNGSIYSGITGLIQRGSNDGAWNGTGGLLTSLPDAVAGLTTVAVGRADDLGYTGGTFGGVPSIAANDVLVMYTYAGDANLDGLISGDDYSAIDFNVLVPGSFGYSNGDFNYDGAITGDDYSAIDFNILAQGAPFPTSAASFSSPTPVPEPTFAAAVAVLPLPGTFLRRRRTSR
jgi:hypothetical protein